MVFPKGVERLAAPADVAKEDVYSYHHPMSASTRVTTPTVAVAGSTGELGGRIAAVLAERGIAQRLPVRAPRRAPRAAKAQVVEVGGYTDRAGMAKALRGIHTLLVLPSTRIDDPKRGHRAMFAVAREAGVRRVVLLSLAVQAGAGVLPRAEAYEVVERDLIESGLDWTIARMNVALDRIPMAVARDGRIRCPGAGVLAPVSYDDLADAMAGLLVDEQWNGRLLNFTGPELLHVEELASLLSAHAPAEVRPAYDASEAPLVGTQTDAWWQELQPALQANAFANPTDDLAAVLGRPAESVDDWLRRHPFALVHVGFTI